jgi:hypothetical protein
MAYGQIDRRAPVSEGGTIVWWEHCRAWDGYSKTAEGKVPSAEQIAGFGGFTLAELTVYLGNSPRTYMS